MVRVQPSLCFFPPPMILFSMEGRGEGAGFLVPGSSCSWFAKFGSRVPGSPSSVFVFLVRHLHQHQVLFSTSVSRRGVHHVRFSSSGISMSQCPQAQGLKVSIKVFKCLLRSYTLLLPIRLHLTCFCCVIDVFLCLLLCVACMCSKTGPGVGAQGREGLLT